MFQPFKKLDHELHFWAGVLIAGVSFMILFACGVTELYAIGIGFSLSVAAAFGKEIYDKNKGGEFDKSDAKFTLLGGTLISVLLLIPQITYIFW